MDHGGRKENAKSARPRQGTVSLIGSWSVMCVTLCDSEHSERLNLADSELLFSTNFELIVRPLPPDPGHRLSEVHFSFIGVIYQLYNACFIF